MPTQIVTPKAFTVGMRNAIYSELTLDGLIESVRQQPEGSGLTAITQEVGLNLRTLARTVRVSAAEYRDLVSDLQAAIGWNLVFGRNPDRMQEYKRIVELMHELDQHSERYVSARRLMQLLLLGEQRVDWLPGLKGANPSFNAFTGKPEVYGREWDLSDYRATYLLTKKGKWGNTIPKTADDLSKSISHASAKLRDLLSIIESATDQQSIEGVVQRRDLLEERMNSSYWAFVAAEWQADQMIKLYEPFLYRKAGEDWRAGREVATFLTFLMLPREEKILLKAMREARIPLVTRMAQGYRDSQLHHSKGLFVAGMLALTTSTVGAAAGVLTPISELVPQLANVEPFKFLGSYVWSMATGVAMYGLTQAGPWTVAKLRSRGRYVQV